jgi:hypothetical protein
MIWSISLALRRSPEQASPEVFSAPRDFAREARLLATEGRHLEAAHQLFLASLQRAAQSGLINLQPNDTNAAVRAALESSSIPSALCTELVALIHTTERAWFRNRTNDPELYARWARAYGQLIQVME